MELIRINKNEKGEQIVSARDLHEFLESKQDFTTWIKHRVEKYGFEENVDFTLHKFMEFKTWKHDYLLKTSVAKELSMVENNEKGKMARKYFIECEEKVNNISSESQQKRLYERSPQELLADNAIALNKMFEALKINIPKEIIISSAITGTSNAIGYDFPEVQCLLNKIDEEAYHTKSEICKNAGIKGNKVNASLVELGLQEEGSTSMQPFVLTELGKQYGVERSFTNGSHQGYEIKLKASAEKYIKDNLDKLPKSWLK